MILMGRCWGECTQLASTIGGWRSGTRVPKPHASCVTPTEAQTRGSGGGRLGADPMFSPPILVTLPLLGFLARVIPG